MNDMMYKNRRLLGAIGIIVVIVALVLVFKWMCHNSHHHPRYIPLSGDRQNFEYIGDDGVIGAPDVMKSLIKPNPMYTNGMNGASKCGSMYGYNYQLPEPLPEVEDLLPADENNGSSYDPEAARNVPYVFNYPFTGTILKSRPQQAGDMWRGDLMIEPEQVCSSPIYSQADTLLHGAFSEHTSKLTALLGPSSGCGTTETWVRDAPMYVQNEGIMY